MRHVRAIVSLFKADWFQRFLIGIVIGLGVTLAFSSSHARAEEAVLAPKPLVDALPSRPLETAVFAGGCFWGVEGVFSHVKGVKLVQSGYAGGPRGRKVGYEQVSRGNTGFAEAVSVTYDPKVISYGGLMQIFFSVIADPTTLNYQGPDHGTQYRSALFPLTEEQGKAARAYLAQLDRTKLWKMPVVTRIEPFKGFVRAEDEHQDFMERNPRHPYVIGLDRPKLAALKRLFPDVYSDRPAL